MFEVIKEEVKIFSQRNWGKDQKLEKKINKSLKGNQETAIIQVKKTNQYLKTKIKKKNKNWGNSGNGKYGEMIINHKCKQQNSGDGRKNLKN